MAKLEGAFGFTGSIDRLSAYKRWDSDKIIIRKKGGPSRHKVKTSPAFDMTRRNGSEFGGRSRASRFIMDALHPVKRLSDHNIAGPINKLLKPVQLMDNVNDLGERSLCLTKNPGILQGFNLNRRNYTFDAIVRNHLAVELDETGVASITLPALIPGINFFVPAPGFPLYRFIMAVGVVPDLYYTKDGYKSQGDQTTYYGFSYNSAWHPVSKGSPAITLQSDPFPPAYTPPAGSYSMLLSLGINFGSPALDNKVEEIKRAGAAKIIAVK